MHVRSAVRRAGMTARACGGRSCHFGLNRGEGEKRVRILHIVGSYGAAVGVAAALAMMGGPERTASPPAAEVSKGSAVRQRAMAPPANRLDRRRSAPRNWDRSLHAHPDRGSYRRAYRMVATAYVPQAFGIEGGRWTKTERDGQAIHGVAVDPLVIPLGTRLWIPGYGHAVADDIGGAIKGMRIDLRMQRRTNMHQWGVRPVRVYILRESRRRS